jgi:hypothetical protein
VGELAAGDALKLGSAPLGWLPPQPATSAASTTAVALAAIAATAALIGLLAGIRPLALFLPGWPQPMGATLVVIIGTVVAYRLLLEPGNR